MSKMDRKLKYLVLIQFMQLCFACQMENVSNWLLRVDVNVLDTYIGTILDRSTSNIEGISSIVYGEGLNRGPYIDVNYENSRFTIATNNIFHEYEEYETSRTMRVTVTFSCSPGSTPLTRPLVFQIDITDTNNHYPLFQPSANFEFAVIPPLPPGFLVTGCENQIIARDVDLTTTRVDFAIEDNPYFEIFYDKSTAPKEFSATLRAKTFIRSISEPLNLIIRATDVDETNDEPKTTTGTVRIIGDTQFQLPEELKFSEVFYTLNYSLNDSLLTGETILLTQGYDDEVEFSHEGEYSDNFEITTDRNEVILSVKSALPLDVLQGPIYLVVRAEREYTSGTAATVIIQLPSARELSFESFAYKGVINGTDLIHNDILLSEGYGEDVTFDIRGEYADLFYYSNDGNKLKLSLNSQLSEEILKANNIITLGVTATGNNTNTALTYIVFEIIKNDTVTPVFAKKIYEGFYINASHVDIEEITLSQGFDETVDIQIFGDNAEYFRIDDEENKVIVSLKSAISENVIFSAKVFILYIVASKPNTVGGNAALVIRFPNELTEPTVLAFSKNTYTGIIENNAVSIENVILENGYTEQVRFNLSGVYLNYFTLSPNGNIISILASDELYQNLDDENSIILNVRAERENAIPVTTTVVINIVKQERVLPVFEKAYYKGVYTENVGLHFDDVIKLTSGFDETVSFELDGENSQWFYIIQNENTVILHQNATISIPNDLIITNKQIVFTVVANKPETIPGRAVMVIELVAEEINNSLAFDKVFYIGSLENNTIALETIHLNGNLDEAYLLSLHGDFSNYFNISKQENIIEIGLERNLPDDILPDNNIITLEIRATREDTIARATVVLKVIEEVPYVQPIRFSQAYYTGQYLVPYGLNFIETISLFEGYDETVEFHLIGESAQWFYIIQDGSSITLNENRTNTVPVEVIETNNQILFTVLANKPETPSTQAVIAIEIIQETSPELNFDRAYYIGSLNNSALILDPITLTGSYDNSFLVTLHGTYANYFAIAPERPTVEIFLQREVSDELLNSEFITLEIRISKDDVIISRATIILKVIKEDTPVKERLRFVHVYYTGSYTSQNVFTFEETISLAEGYDETVKYVLEGDQSTWFQLEQSGRTAKLILLEQIPLETINSNSNLIFEVHANRASDTATTRSTIIITIVKDDTSSAIMRFERQAYVGSINGSELILDPIILAEGFNDRVTFRLIGELNGYFSTSPNQNEVTLILQRPIPEDDIPDNRIVTIDIQAVSETTARATIVLKVIRNEGSVEVLSFEQLYYSGSYKESSGLTFDPIIRLKSGFEDAITFRLEGDYSPWFDLRQNGNSATLVLSSITLPDDILNHYNQLIFVVRAQKSDSEVILASSVIIISLAVDSPNVRFDKVLYRGRVENGVVVHETVSVSNYNGNVEISGEYGQQFGATITNGIVTVTLTDINFSTTLSYVALKLNAAEVTSVLLLDVIKSDTPVEPPNLSFSSSSYVLEALEGFVGVVGRVSATADNGEGVTYSLEIENEHLKQRLAVYNDGEIVLTTPADVSTYNFEVSARTIMSQVTASATVQLTIIETSDIPIALPPLIILERNEEAPHLNLVPLDRIKYPNCVYSLTNKWPEEQNWLYVDENGLHTRSIDREHESIAFMPVSQVQVELNLNCNQRSKRSIDSNTWILTDSISYNPRRTMVNLVVKDINDNAPLFGMDSVTVGYPRADIAEVVLPRALAELKATDADIEENALIRYSSSDDMIVVSPTSGSVHLRNPENLEDNARFTVKAIDRNGTDLEGSIDISVRLLERNQIAVVTVRNAFLDDEMSILDDLTRAVGYEIKPLRSTVISESRYENEADKSRVRRDVNTNGASLRLYVYALRQREPVDVAQLTADLSNNSIVTVSLGRVLSLEDHLGEVQICPALEREIGLLAATIVLAVLLLIVIVAVGVWAYLQRKKANNYDQFSDQNSLRSRNDSIESPKVEAVYTTPRLNIGELRKSEKKLQERLEAKEPVKQETSKKIPQQSKVDVLETDSKWPIVIQSIDKLKDNADESDDDDFGEKQRSRRKSVVTFNENVEKIIHLEDTSLDGESEADVEIEKL